MSRRFLPSSLPGRSEIRYRQRVMPTRQPPIPAAGPSGSLSGCLAGTRVRRGVPRPKTPSWLLAVIRSALAGIGFPASATAAIVATSLPNAAISDSVRSRVERALAEDFSIRTWGVAEGLPSEQVLCLTQSREGYLWVGTAAGLVRFDGVRFVRFDHSNVRALDDHRIRRVAEDAGGHLWMTTADHALRLLGPGGWSVPRLGRETVTVTDGPTRDGNGGVRIFTTAGWLRGVSTDPPTPESPPVQLERIPLAGLDVLAWMEHSGDDQGWVEPNQVVLEQTRIPGTIRFPLQPVERRSMAVAATALARDGSRWILFGQYNHSQTFRLYRVAHQEMVLVDGGVPPPSRLPMILTPDHDAGVWHGNWQGGIGRTTPTSRILYTLPEPESRASLVDVLVENAGDIWLALERGGLLQLRPRRMQSFGPSSGLPNPVVRSLMSGNSGSIWAGTDSGVARLDRATTPEAPWILRTDGLEGASVRALAQTSDGILWAGTARGLYAKRGGTWMPHPMPERVRDSDSEGLGSLKVRDLLALRNGDLWVATPHQIVAVSADDGASRRLAAVANLGPMDLLEDRAGNIWIATERGGVVVVGATSPTDLATREFTPVPGFLEDRWRLRPVAWLREHRELPSDHAWELLEDHEGTMWIAGPRGLVRIPAAGARAIVAGRTMTTGPDADLFVFTEVLGLPESGLNCLVTDHLGSLWMGGDRGIYRTRLDEFRSVVQGRSKGIAVESFTRAEGLPSDETNGRLSHRGAILDDHQQVWFGTTGGLVCFPPRLSSDKPAAPRVVIEEVRIDGEVLTTTLPQLLEGGKTQRLSPRPPDTGNDRVETTSRISPRTTIEPGRGRVIEIRFTGLDPSAPQALRFRYQLAGFENEIHEVADRRVAYFTNLDPGQYRFRVWAVGRAGVASVTPAEFEFTLTPHLWQTRWFQALTAATVLASGAGMVARRIRRVRHLEELRRRAEQAELRARLARDLHDGVGSGLARLAVLAHLPENGDLPPESVPSRLRDLSGAVRELAETIREISWNANPSPISLESLVAQIAQQTGEYLGAAGIRCRTSLPLEFPDFQLAPDQRADLYFAAKELCANTVRHARATEARFEAILNEHTLIIVLHDNGQGFAVDDLGPSSAESPRPSVTLNGGNGIPNLRARVARLGGRLTFDSAPGSGTTVRMEIPLVGLTPVAGSAHP
ncbi:MAG: hypothetical protein JNK85_04400 [Verrucomicrobiales bacterium]|nr:hypothetical protein [Verrucomicrobiales bacterium]